VLSESPLLSTSWKRRLGGLTPMETSGVHPTSCLETEVTRPFRCCRSGHASEAESNRRGLTHLRLQLPSCGLEPRQSGPALLVQDLPTPPGPTGWDAAEAVLAHQPLPNSISRENTEILSRTNTQTLPHTYICICTYIYTHRDIYICRSI